VRHLAESAAQRGGFTLDLQTSSNALRFDADIELVAYRITQEALTNIVEHANASLVSLTLNVTPHTIALCIEDNGSGFDVEQARQQGRFGLQGMYERAAMLAAELTIQSVAGQGTKIQLLVEVKP
jgi:signal transduction histidine kinase